MRNLLFIFILLSTMLSTQSCMKRIDAGHTGIRFNYYGITDQKGISDRELVSGVVWYNPFTRGVYEYPHFWQDQEYEHISFNSLEGEPIYTSLKVVYRFVRDNIPTVFDEYRESPKSLSNGIIQSIVLEELSAQAGDLAAVNIMGRSREELLRKTTTSLNSKYGELIEFDLITFTTKLTPSENVKAAIQGVIQAQEKAKAAEARTVEVEEAAKQRIINAKADSTSRVVLAAGDAKAIELVQDQLSTNPRYIDYVKAKAWNGELPQVTGEVTPFFNIK